MTFSTCDKCACKHHQLFVEILLSNPNTALLQHLHYIIHVLALFNYGSLNLTPHLRDLAQCPHHLNIDRLLERLDCACIELSIRQQRLCKLIKDELNQLLWIGVTSEYLQSRGKDTEGCRVWQGSTHEAVEEGLCQGVEKGLNKGLEGLQETVQ